MDIPKELKKLEKRMKAWRRTAITLFFMMLLVGSPLLFAASRIRDAAQIAEEKASSLERALVTCVSTETQLAQRVTALGDSVGTAYDSVKVLLNRPPKWRTHTVYDTVTVTDTLWLEPDSVLVHVPAYFPVTDTLYMPPDTIKIIVDSWVPAGGKSITVNLISFGMGIFVRSLFEKDDSEIVYVDPRG